MGCLKNYQLALICLGSDFMEQQAIERALVQGWYKPACMFNEDKAAVLRLLSSFVEKFKQEAAANEAVVNTPTREFINQLANVP